MSISTGSAFNDFRCKGIPADTPSNVTELQFCDGVSNCMDGSDEPQHCPAGKLLHMVPALVSQHSCQPSRSQRDSPDLGVFVPRPARRAVQQ